MSFCELKICGFTRRSEVVAAARLGVDFVGAVLVAGSRRAVPAAALPELFGDLPGRVRRVGVFAGATANEIGAALATGCLDIVQLHGAEPPELVAELGRRVEVWQAFPLAGSGLPAALMASPAARLVLDGPRGGSGELCDWRLAAAVAGRRPVMLAGGITPGNVAAAMAAVRPAGIDLAGGVETDYGVKSMTKIVQLLKEMGR